MAKILRCDVNYLQKKRAKTQEYKKLFELKSSPIGLRECGVNDTVRNSKRRLNITCLGHEEA